MRHLFYRFFIFQVLFISIFAYANPGSGTLQGRVTDAETGKPLLGVNVIIEHTTIGSATNVNGEFILKNIPDGDVHISATMMGYQRLHKDVHLENGGTATVDFHLKTAVLEMGALVVTGTGTPHLFEDMPVKTSVISRRVIEQKQCCNLAESLTFATGVRVENDCQNCNFSQVRILGMDGKYSQILIDGDPVVSSLAGVYGLEQIPEEMIDQIEIVKGGGSSLYGGGAVAGVVNLRLRRPLTNRIRIKANTQSIKGAPDHRLGVTAEFLNDEGTSGGFISGSGRDRNPFDYNDDGYSELGKLQNESFGFNWFLKPIRDGELTTHIHRIHENRRGGNKFDKPHHEAQISESVEHWRWGGTVKWVHRPTSLWSYQMFYSFASQDRRSYYGGLGTETPTAEDSVAALSAYGISKNPLQIAGMQTNVHLDGHLLTAGLQYKTESLEDNATSNPIYNIDEQFDNIGIFIQDNFHLGSESRLEFVVGARLDKHSEIEDPVISPRINIKYNLTRYWTMRAAYTTGFKAPQIYDEDLHLCGIAGEQRVTRNSKDLKPEYSQSFSGGIDFNHNVNGLPVMFGMTGFYTLLTDAFAEEEVGAVDDVMYLERINAGEAYVQGMEFELGIQPVPALEMRGGVTVKTSEYDKVVDVLEDEDGNVLASSKKFLRTPDLYGFLWGSYSFSDHLSCFASVNYTGEADVPHEGEGEIKTSDSYLELDAGMTLKLGMTSGVQYKLTGGVKNIFDAYQEDLDKGVERDPAYVYGPANPRTVYFGIETTF